VIVDDGLFLSSSTDVGLMTASSGVLSGGILSIADVKIFQEASSFLKFVLRFSAYSKVLLMVKKNNPYLSLTIAALLIKVTGLVEAR
jgi:hypothetical protein